MTIMSVDDSATMRKIINMAIKIKGHNLIEAENGKDALSKIDSHDIDLFIVDINMPVMNGIEFIKELRKRQKYSKTPIIILTTENEEDMKLEGQKAGANAWIVKPFDTNEFLKLIELVSKK